MGLDMWAKAHYHFGTYQTNMVIIGPFDFIHQHKKKGD